MRARALGAAALVAGAAIREVRAVVRLLRHRGPRQRDHDAIVGGGAVAPLQLLLLGDSAVDGHGLRAEDALPRRLAALLAGDRPVSVTSLAVSGATSADVLAFQAPAVTADADVVVVGVGVNDALRLVHLDAVADATRQLVEGVRVAAPGASLVVVPCHDLGTAPGPGPVLGLLLGWRCRRVARTQRAVLDDLGVAVAQGSTPAGAGDVADLYGTDGLHPGPAGVRAIAASVIAALAISPPRG